MIEIHISNIIIFCIIIIFLFWKIIKQNKYIRDLEDELGTIEEDILIIKDVECTCPECGNIFTEDIDNIIKE